MVSYEHSRTALPPSQFHPGDERERAAMDACLSLPGAVNAAMYGGAPRLEDENGEDEDESRPA